jgi:hypothetical protein
MHSVYSTNSDCAVGYGANLAAAQLFAQDYAHRHRTTTVTVKDPGGSLVYTAPVRAKASSQGT